MEQIKNKYIYYQTHFGAFILWGVFLFVGGICCCFGLFCFGGGGGLFWFALGFFVLVFGFVFLLFMSLGGMRMI